VADIDVHRSHALGIDGAREAADRMMEGLASRFGLRGRWDGNVLRFDRPGVSGALAVDEQNVHITVTLGLLLKAMRGSIEGAVVQQLDQILRPSGAASPGPNRSPR